MSKKILTTALGLIAASLQITQAADNGLYFTPKLFYGWSKLEEAQQSALAQHYQVGTLYSKLNNFSLGFDIGYKINSTFSTEFDILEFTTHNTFSNANKINHVSNNDLKIPLAPSVAGTPDDDTSSATGSDSSFDLGSMTIPPSSTNLNDSSPPPSTTGDDSLNGSSIAPNGQGNLTPSGDSTSSSSTTEDSQKPAVLDNEGKATLSRTILWFSCKTALYHMSPELHAWGKAGIALISFHAHSADPNTAQSANLDQKNSMSLTPVLGLGISYEFTSNVAFDFSANYIFGVKNSKIEHPGITFISAGLRLSFE